MMKRISAMSLIIGMLSVPALAQAPITPQQSREQAPNMPALNETVPERVRPADPDSTGSIRVRQPEKELPEAKDGDKKSG
ncbi:hypothetical protein [Methylobacterium durans]|nr:hypothetical protein [Methylobacterium durans]